MAFALICALVAGAPDRTVVPDVDTVVPEDMSNFVDIQSAKGKGKEKHDPLANTWPPGACMSGNVDQDQGVVKLDGGDYKGSDKEAQCLAKCQAYGIWTGCEVIWDQDNRGCYVHTQPVNWANLKNRHGCLLRGQFEEATNEPEATAEQEEAKRLAKEQAAAERLVKEQAEAKRIEAWKAGRPSVHSLGGSTSCPPGTKPPATKEECMASASTAGGYGFVQGTPDTAACADVTCGSGCFKHTPNQHVYWGTDTSGKPLASYDHLVCTQSQLQWLIPE